MLRDCMNDHRVVVDLAFLEKLSDLDTIMTNGNKKYLNRNDKQVYE